MHRVHNAIKGPHIGIDITQKDFWDNGIDEVERLLNDCEELAKKLGKI